MQSRSHLNAPFLLLLLSAATAAEAQVQPELAKRYFEEATKLCERDAGRLWGVSLCGPMVIVYQATGTPAAGSGSSDTRDNVGIPGVGTVFFHNFTLSARWGRLNVDNGVLRSVDGTTLSVPVTRPLEGATPRGEGWSITLNAGWVVRSAARAGSFTIVREN